MDRVNQDAMMGIEARRGGDEEQSGPPPNSLPAVGSRVIHPAHHGPPHNAAGQVEPRADEAFRPPDQSRLEPDSEIRRLLKDDSLSSLAKYRWLTVGRDSNLALLHYEILMACLAGLRGAAGVYLRSRLYRGLFRSLGRNVVIGRNVTIRHPHRIEIGDGVVVDDNVVLDGKGDQPCTIRIGAGTIIGRNSMLICKGGTIDLSTHVNVSVNCTMISESSLSLGAKSLVGGHCYLCAGGNHGTDDLEIPIVDQPRASKGGIRIAEDCWLCAQAAVFDGVTVGPHSIVAAGAVVKDSVPPYRVYGGVPARELYDRQATFQVPSAASKLRRTAAENSASFEE
jgi:acetyltransferase-like isoleucine patch superfamily enzyme